MENFASDNGEACERLPLTSRMSSRQLVRESYTFSPEEGHLKLHSESDDLAVHGITDQMMYRTKSLTTWESFLITYTTVWYSRELWVMVAKLTAVSLIATGVTILCVPDPERLKVYKFTSLSKFLVLVVGLLLGFFLSSSMNRWHSCVNGFLELLDAIRNLQMQFVALGVPDEQSNLTLRYAFASAWLLYGMLLVESKPNQNGEQAHQRKIMWERLRYKAAYIYRSDSQATLFEQEEIDVLNKCRDPPGILWMWVAAHIGRLSQDGWIPPMQTPTYGRIMNLCQGAHAGIRQVRASISVQAPLTYTHMLASLVHVNNLLCAVTFGIVSGCAIGTAMMRSGVHIYANAKPSEKETVQDGQNMAVTFFYCFFGPLLYQALLLISMHLAQPFDSEDARIPLDRLLHQLEVDMCNGRDLVDHLDFEKPSFKQSSTPAPKAAPAPTPAAAAPKAAPV